MALDSRASSRSAGQTERKAPTSTKEDKQRLTKRRQRRETKRNETARRYSFVLCVCVCVSFQGKRLSRAVFEFKVARFRMAEASLVAAITAAVFFFFFFCCSTSSFSFFSFSSRSRPFLSYKFSRFSKAPPSSFFFLKETPGRSFCCLFCSFFLLFLFLSLSLSLSISFKAYFLSRLVCSRPYFNERFDWSTNKTRTTTTTRSPRDCSVESSRRRSENETTHMMNRTRWNRRRRRRFSFSQPSRRRLFHEFSLLMTAAAATASRQGPSLSRLVLFHNILFSIMIRLLLLLLALVVSRSPFSFYSSKVFFVEPIEWGRGARITEFYLVFFLPFGRIDCCSFSGSDERPVFTKNLFEMIIFDSIGSRSLFDQTNLYRVSFCHFTHRCVVLASPNTLYLVVPSFT